MVNWTTYVDRKRQILVICCVLTFLHVYISISNYTEDDTVAKSSGAFRDHDFIDTLQEFEWNNLLAAYKNKKLDASNFSFWYSKLLMVLTPWIVMPPKVAVNTNTSCNSPPPLKFPFNAPPCNRLKGGSRKVAALFQLGFDADTLEIHLHELDKLVDKFFIIESTATYYLGVQKPLIWELLRRQPRFEIFVHKVVHFVLDDQELLVAQLEALESENGGADARPHSIEILQERMRWLKFVEWNTMTKTFNINDLVGFGDVDEVPNRNVVHYLKECEMPSDPIDIATWFPFGRIDQAFQTDAPVRGHIYSLGNPTYWTLKTAMNYNGKKYSFTSVPSRLRGHSPGFIIGGMHMTEYGYFPFTLNKLLTIIEGFKTQVQSRIASKIEFVMDELRINISTNMSAADKNRAFANMETELAKTPAHFLHRIIKVSDLKLKNENEFRMLVQLPWFYDCNRERYPAWEGKHDNRLDV
ncbi:unnamed protein product [Orchesella dallaii]|uniref:Glycosyltransferase family 92 protein n=1 Tax=Orchesella dallaii TaxID=48710 RepID=A0ABP1PKK2_9HEXA